ncbi:MAG: hypothetical protein IPK04_21615 [Bdellovibrionales bacterium]|nr:hypothetical protein [Bdellovibrionales bacterium]
MHRISTVGLPGVGGGPYQAFLGYRTDEIFPGMTRSDIFTQYEDLVKANPGYTNKARQLYKVHTSEDGTFDPPLFSSDRFKFTALENAIAEFKVDIFQTQGLSHTNSELNFKLKGASHIFCASANTA